MYPPVLELAETFLEPPAVHGRVAERKPHDLGISVNKCALGDLPDDIGDS